MATPSYREGVNPLRPYYIPPSLAESGVAGSASATTSTMGSAGTAAAAATSSAVKNSSAAASAAGRYSSKARDMFSDLDYKDYISEPSPSMVTTARELVDDMLWKYTSVLMSQPFEVAKVLLQVRTCEEPEESQSVEPLFEAPKKRAVNPYSDGGFGFGDDSENEEQGYFTSGFEDPSNPLFSQQNRKELDPFAEDEPEEKPKPAPTVLPPHQLPLTKPNSVNEVIAQLWAKEGAWGVWKGSNSTFVYNVLQSLLENWSRSFLSAVFNVPDIGVKDDIDKLVGIASPYPWASLCVAAAAAVATGLVLCPLDLVRTRLLITPSSKGPRRTVSVLRSLPSYVCPPLLIIPTVFHSLVNPLLTLSTPLALRTQFRIDAEQSPMTYSFVKFCASAASIFIKLPIETVLRRAQIHVISSPEYVHAADPEGNALETIVPVGRYNGVFGTMYHIAAEEGVRKIDPVTSKPTSSRPKRSSRTKVAETVYLKGQGLEGLWRGWKVNWWGLVGLWTANMVGNSGEGEF
ncbi:hypothetical protein TD95_001281 [Thielaviopsis punctulata]|uniref:Mitochondrial fusion and transport protein ugo1 n=1 Tax=Thielaviopsis punctulata TaxID=72032 RepID=A0A0F4ZB59_9PEZI|nr:hypothetical protein TD95_001281 [Thielaviopsis punctulata]